MPPSSPLPRVSVALCTYNGERHLREQLDSILAQRGVEVDIVALDDGSSDGTVALLREYAARDPRVVVHRNERNLGHLRSFEKCMAMCAADYIAPSDQDDVWHPDKLRVLLGVIGGADMAYCDSEYVDEDGNALGGRISGDLPAMHSGRDPLRYIFQNTVSGHACLFRRGLLALAGPAPELLYHDWWLAMCASAHDGVVYVDRPLVRFRRHGQAYSPLGKRKAAAASMSKADKREHGRRLAQNRKWLAERLYVANALAGSGWLGADAAATFRDALQAAMQGDSDGLWPAIWAMRRSLPPWRGPGWFRAAQFQRRCARKIARAAGEPAIPGRLFRS